MPKPLVALEVWAVGTDDQLEPQRMVSVRQSAKASELTG